MYNYIISMIGIIICYTICLRCFKLISNKNIKILNIKNVLIIIFISTTAFFNNQYNYSPSRLLINFFLLYFLFAVIFNEKMDNIFVKTLIIYFFMCFFEIIFSFSISFSKEINIMLFDKQYILKTLFSANVSLFTLLVFEIKYIRNILIQIYKSFLLNNEKIIKSIIYLYFFLMLILLFNASLKLSINIYLTQIIIFLILLFFVFISIHQYIKTKKAESKEKILLEFMSNYEKLLDTDRINKHEILNNLLILKSFKNKNSKKYEETLNTIIDEYENKNNKILTNLYNLPTGLKGLIYYKVYEIQNLKIDVSLFISPKVLIILEKTKAKIFIKLCKILGILLDNAKEASEKSEEKIILIDIYKENNEIIFFIENSTNEEVNFNKIYNKNYSTKGKNRGFGLYILNSIINSIDDFEINQYINEKKRFVSILKLKNNKTHSN